MLVKNSQPAPHPKLDPNVSSLLQVVTEDYLREVVAAIAFPRHYIAEASANRRAALYIEDQFNGLGLQTYRQGPYDNIVATLGGELADARVLIGAHYDSVPGSPGADDNASAVGGMLAAARALSKLDGARVAFVAFNREEDGLLGSTDFVENHLRHLDHSLALVNVLEMIGYCDRRDGSQRMPEGLPVKLDGTADFLGVIANRHSNRKASMLLETASHYCPELPVKVLKVFLGMEKYFPHLLRSDHSPFWTAHVPALMWTDTAEFRNPHYHAATDTADTLDFGFMRAVVQLLVVHTAILGR